jgi:glycosidase
VKKEFPDTLIVGEVWHYAADFLQGDTWDTVMNYPFLNAALDFVAEETITASEYLDELGFLRGNLNTACYPVLWNLIGSHDTPRALHRCGGSKKKLMLLAAMQMLLPGMPFIYYGDEVGMTGGADPDCRRGMLWDPRRQDTELFAYYQKLIRLRKANPCLTEGDPVDLCADDENGVVMIDRGDLVVLVHGCCGTVELPQYKGLHELICDTPFSGILGPYQAALLRK